MKDLKDLTKGLAESNLSPFNLFYVLKCDENCVRHFESIRTYRHLTVWQQYFNEHAYTNILNRNPVESVLIFLGVYISIGEKGDKNTERDQSIVFSFPFQRIHI